MENVDVDELSDEELEDLEEQIARRKQKFKWRGDGGIYKTARQIPLDIHKDDSLDSDEKKEELQNQLREFLNERFE